MRHIGSSTIIVEVESGSMLLNVDDDGNKEVWPWHFSLREIDLTHYDTSLPTESATHAIGCP